MFTRRGEQLRLLSGADATFRAVGGVGGARSALPLLMRDGEAFDLCPRARSGESARQAMAFTSAGERDARVGLLVDSAAVYHLDTAEAQDIVDEQVSVIRETWDEVCDAAELTSVQRAGFLGHQILNPHAFE